GRERSTLGAKPSLAATFGHDPELRVEGPVLIGLHARRARALLVLAKLDLEAEGARGVNGLATIADQPRPRARRLARSHRSLARPRQRRTLGIIPLGPKIVTRTDHGLEVQLAVARDHQHLDARVGRARGDR